MKSNHKHLYLWRLSLQMNAHWTGVPETLLGGFPEKAPQPPPLISSLSEINEKKAIANQLEIKPIRWQLRTILPFNLP